MSEILYHYCDMQVFKSIIENKSIRLTDITKSNDDMEKKWLIKQYQDYLSNSAIRLTNNEVKNILLAEINGIESLYDLAKSYVFCMSEKGDDLSQWRGYGNDGCGIAIGFDKDYFDFLHSSGATSCTLSLEKVRYSITNPSGPLDFSTGGYINDNTNPEELLRGIQLCRDYFGTQALYYKHPSFADEAEWRLCMPVISGWCEYLLMSSGESECSNRFNSKFLPIERHYLERCDNIVSYLELKFKHLPDVIEKIYIGPKAKLTVADMRLFLGDNGFHNAMHIDILPSKSTYR